MTGLPMYGSLRGGRYTQTLNAGLFCLTFMVVGQRILQGIAHNTYMYECM